MLLDMLTTSDAAAQHGHEYSPPRSSNAAPASYNGSFLLTQMPLSILTSVIRKQTSTLPNESNLDTPTSGVAASTTNTVPLTTSPIRASNPPLMSAPVLHTLQRADSPAPSRPASSSSTATASTEVRPQKRQSRPKTIYNFAQPPPITAPLSKLHIRPKVLLQLHQVIPSRRPKPVYEVIPFSLLAPRSTRRLARTFYSKEKLGPNDLLVVKAEEYEQKEDAGKSDEEQWGTRDVIGIICPPKKADKGSSDNTELLMDDGSSWDVTYMSNGGYEFNYTDHHGLLLRSRWVPKPAHSRRTSAMSTSSFGNTGNTSPAVGTDDKKFNFSTISATSRRHPVIASMTRSGIEILDSYNMPTATSPPTPLTSTFTYSTPGATPIIESASFMDVHSENIPVKTDDALRRFITVSGIWVAFCENWSPAYASSKNATCPYNISTTGIRPFAPTRAVSMSFLDSPRSLSPASTSDENHRSLPKLFRSGSTKSHRNSSFTSSTPVPESTKSSPTSSPRVKNRSRRSNSTGNADLKMRNGSVRKRFGVAFEDEALPETEEERQIKRSTELLRIREFSLPDTPLATTTPTPSSVPQETVAQERDSPASSPDLRARKTQSAYEPVVTAGLWDSGVIDGSGLKARPTSMFVANKKKEKKDKKSDWSKSKEKKLDREMEKERKRQAKQLAKEQQKEDGHKHRRFKQVLLGIFRRDKS